MKRPLVSLFVTDQAACQQYRGVHARDAAAHDLPLPEKMAQDPVPAAFAEVYERHFDYVWRALRRLGVAESDLEDLAHDVFLAVHRRLDQLDPNRPARPWLFAFALRVASAHRRRARARHEVVGLDNQVASDDPTALERVIQGEALALAQAALDTLDLEKRAVFILHEIDGYSMPEVSLALEIPLNTAYSRLRLARTRFAAALKRAELRRSSP
ncbi:MAG TPA: RNA polymerase sigma factor [Polyangiaceae bacterium]|nr:RNA polymerase sigma factor [Polyangiaceae bacterium]